MNQTEIARKLANGGCPVSTQFISAVVRGERRFGIRNAKMVGEIFKVDPAIFLLGTIEDVKKALDYKRGNDGN